MHVRYFWGRLKKVTGHPKFVMSNLGRAELRWVAISGTLKNSSCSVASCKIIIFSVLSSHLRLTTLIDVCKYLWPPSFCFELSCRHQAKWLVNLLAQVNIQICNVLTRPWSVFHIQRSVEEHPCLPRYDLEPFLKHCSTFRWLKQAYLILRCFVTNSVT